VGGTALSWNIIDDIRLMWSLPSMLNAFRAGTVVAILAAIVGWYMVVRRQSFAGHTLSVVGFPGAAAAVYLGIGVAYGYFAFCLVAALVIALAVLVALAVIGRPLLFASVDSALARSRGVPTRALDIAFLVLLGITVAEVSQVTGALLVFALLALPAATSQQLTARPGRGLAISVGLALATVWLALTGTFFSSYPVGFWLTTIAFVFYVIAAGYRKVVR